MKYIITFLSSGQKRGINSLLLSKWTSLIFVALLIGCKTVDEQGERNLHLTPTIVVFSTLESKKVIPPPREESLPVYTPASLPTSLPITDTPSEVVATKAPASNKPLNKLGVHLLLDDGRNQWPVDVWEEHLRYARDAVGDQGFVIELIRSDNLDVEHWQYFMDLCSEFQLTPILRLATTYDQESGWWQAPQPDNNGEYRLLASQYAQFIADLDWPADRHYVIVGNEPNHGNEWSGRPNPAAYALFLINVAEAVHAVDPQAIILNAGLDPYTPHTGSEPFIDGMYYLDEETFLDEMVSAYPSVFSHIDIWASHAYPTGPLTEGPWSQTFSIDLIGDAENPEHIQPPLGIYNRGINGYEWELFKLKQYGVNTMPVMITETGWRHSETTDPEASDNGRPLPPAATIASYLDLSLRGNRGRHLHLPDTGWTPWLNDNRVLGVVVFALNGIPAEWGHTNLLALDSQGHVIGTYEPFDVFTTVNDPRSKR